MNSLPLQNNNDLFEFLVRLSETLQSCGAIELANQVKTASRFFSGSPSEFLHEAQQALKKVRTQTASTLSEAERHEITQVILQIEVAFIEIGGA